MDNIVRFALRADLDRLAASLADAFTDNPMIEWIYPDAVSRPELSAAFMRAALDAGFPHGHVYAAADGAAAAIWSPPDVELFDHAAVARLFGLLTEQVGDRAREVGEGVARIAEAHPHEVSHFYLFIIGTVRSAQSRGIGSRLLDEVLIRCDRQGLGAYLESSDIRNVPFYERHGFRVVSEIEVSAEFVSRPMWRDPR